MFDIDDDNDDDNSSSLEEKNKTTTKNKDDTGNKISMERCIAQLEPILDKFRTSCILKDNTRKKKKRCRHQGHSSSSNADTGEEDMDANVNTDEDEDEIPPQLTRTARFFPHIFQPIKRALLRPYIISSSDVESTIIQTANDYNNGNDNTINGLSVELGIFYRLRLVKACIARGLVAVAEYETLRQSIHQAKGVGRSTHNDDDDDDHDCDENMTTTKRQKTNSKGEDEDEDDDALTERVRLSLLRLPSSSSSSRGRSNAAWRHVVDTLSTWSIRWKEEEEEVRRTIKDAVDNESSSTKFPTHKFHSSSSNLVDPDQVADWAMSSWTAILLLRGEMDYNRSIDPMHDAAHLQQQQHFDNDSIETRLANMLSNRHCRHDNGNNSNANSSTFDVLTHAVKCRIDNLLSPEIIVSLNAIHLFSLGRLLSLFHNRNDAIEHIVKSIIKCSSSGSMTMSTTNASGGGGLNLFVGMEQLSRLLAVYVSCCCATSSTTTTTTSMMTLSSSSIASDIERDLRTKLDNDQVVRIILLENQSMKEGNHVVIDNSKTQAGHTPPPPSSATIDLIKRRAISFLQLILCATAHLVGGCCKQ
jgi:hypothetical protein